MAQIRHRTLSLPSGLTRGLCLLNDDPYRPSRHALSAGEFEPSYGSILAAVGSLHKVAASSYFLVFFLFFQPFCRLRLAMVLFDVRFFLSGVIIRGFVPDFQFGQRSVLNARSDLQPTRLALVQPGSAAERLYALKFCLSAELVSILSIFAVHAVPASKWVSLFHSLNRTTASLRAKAVRAFFAPNRLTSPNPQLLRAERLLTVVKRQLAAS